MSLQCHILWHFVPVASSVDGRKSMLTGLIFCFVGLNGTPRSKKKKRKNNRTQEVQESPPEMNSMLAAEAEEQGEAKAKGGGMEEWDTTDAAASGMCACTHPLTFNVATTPHAVAVHCCY